MDSRWTLELKIKTINVNIISNTENTGTPNMKAIFNANSK